MSAEPARAHQEPDRLQPTTYEYRQDTLVVARAVLVGDYLPGQTRWKVEVLPDSPKQYLTNRLAERMGEVWTEARTPEQAQRALRRIAEAVLAFLDARDRLVRSLDDEITQAASAVGVTEVPLPLGEHA